MASLRIARVNELIRREIGEALFRLLNEASIDVAAITVTHVVTTPNLRSARVLVSIRDHQDEREAMMSLLRRHRAEMQARIGKNLSLKYTPRLRFELDTSLERGDHILDILSKMEQEREATGGTNPRTPPEPERPTEVD